MRARITMIARGSSSTRWMHRLLDCLASDFPRCTSKPSLPQRATQVWRPASSPRDRKHREACMRFLASRGRKILARRLLLTLLPNGDWTQPQVQMFVPFGAPFNQGEADKMVANGLVTALAGQMFELYPRSRWCGADISIDRCGLLESVHQLGSGTYRRFMERLDERR